MSTHWWLPDEEPMPKLSQKTLGILKQIAQEQSYDDVSTNIPDWLEVANAIKEVLAYVEADNTPATDAVATVELLAQYPRAHEAWTDNEDGKLSSLFNNDMPITDIAGTLQRDPASIRNRLRTLGLLPTQNNGNTPRVMVQNID